MSRNILAISETDENVRIDDSYAGRSPSVERVATSKITQGQLEAVALRFREELNVSLQRTGTAATATIKENVLFIELAHSLSAAT